MFCKVRQDFKRLFTRENDQHFDAIDGFRCIANLSIIYFHIVTLLSACLNPSPDPNWTRYLNSLAFALNNLLNLNLEIFFVLSSFLLTTKLLNQSNGTTLNNYLFLILKRIVRFWPGMLLTTLFFIWLGEPIYPHGGFIFECFRHLNVYLFIQNYIDLDWWYASYAPLWTISLDLQFYLVFPIVLYLLHSIRNYISLSRSLSVLLILSIVRNCVIFDPDSMPVLNLTHEYPSLALLCPKYLFPWLKQNYNLTFEFNLPEANPTKLFMHQLYLPFESRFGSFLVGSLVAVRLNQSSNHENQPRTYQKKLYVFLIIIYMLLMKQNSSFIIPPRFIYKLLIGSCRQIYAVCQGFLLFTCVCSSTHSYYSKVFRQCLSSSIWIPMSKLSYLVYVIHWPISFHFVFSTRFYFSENASITFVAFIYFVFIVLLCQIIASIWFVFVDQPIQRLFNSLLFNRQFIANKGK